MAFVDAKLSADVRAFNERGQLGPDPLTARYAERRSGYSLFAGPLTDQDIEALRPYLFCYSQQGIPSRPGQPKTTVRAPATTIRSSANRRTARASTIRSTSRPMATSCSAA